MIMTQINCTNSLKQTRNSNIELLRILSMLLIIAFHAIRSGFMSVKQPFIVYSSAVVFGSWGILGVDLFLMISAWFLCEQSFRLKKVISIVFQTFSWVAVYNIVYFISMLLFQKQGLLYTLKDWFQSTLNGFFQPLWSTYYWFITCYIFMLFLSPLLNKLLHSCTQRQMKKILFLFAFVLIYAQFSSGTVGDIFYFLYIYLLIGSIRHFNQLEKMKVIRFSRILLLILVVVISKLLPYFLPERYLTTIFLSILNNTTGAISRHSIILLVLAWQIFFYTLQRKPSYHKTVNRVASTALGIYLFHENKMLNLKNTLDFTFEKLINHGFLETNIFFPLKYILIVGFIFLLGFVLEEIRMFLLQKPFMNFISRKYQNAIEKADAWMNAF
jgi:surface polysaccharide O-acyltransferase-like enzyme